MQKVWQLPNPVKRPQFKNKIPLWMTKENNKLQGKTVARDIDIAKKLQGKLRKKFRKKGKIARDIDISLNKNRVCIFGF